MSKIKYSEILFKLHLKVTPAKKIEKNFQKHLQFINTCIKI